MSMNTAVSLPSPDELKALWLEVYAPRSAVHRRYRVRACDVELRMSGLKLGTRSSNGPTPVTGYRLTGGCPCRDVVTEAIEIVVAFLTDRDCPMSNPPGAVRQHLRYRMVDHYRRARGEAGAQVKPDSVKYNRYGKLLPDDFHRGLYVMLADEAGVRAPLRGHEGFLRRLADRCVTDQGGTPEDFLRLLPPALQLIERICRTGPRVNVGPPAEPELVSWWEAYIERPLGRRDDPSVHSILRDTASASDSMAVEIPDPVAMRAFDHVLSAIAAGPDAEFTSEDDVVVRTLRTAVENATPDRIDDELLNAITLLGERDLLPWKRVRILLTDARQGRAVATHVQDL